MAPTVRVVVQARMRSSRLPGKIMAPLAGRPVLAHVVGRLQAAGKEMPVPGSTRWEVLVATSAAPADDETEALCRRLGVLCFRGPEDDVLARYVAASDDLDDDDHVVRATADNPFYCPPRSAAIVAEHLRSEADYTFIENLSYVVPEAVRAGALRKMAALAADARCREHVTPYFRESGGPFRVRQLPPTWLGLRPDIRLTVDTAAEFERMAWIFEQLSGAETMLALDDVYRLCDRSPALQQLRQVQDLDRLSLTVQPATDIHQAAGVGRDDGIGPGREDASHLVTGLPDRRSRPMIRPREPGLR